ncbi:MAG: Rpn family recombination-promoting nuclease/putative transposase [Clostridiales bacterium]|nr:Rpn family recombination-promoting nuclease/putative transposase [Clostridiales bacterium]
MEHNREYYFDKLQTLNLSDDFLFRTVMRNPEICREVIEEILEIKIKEIKYIEEQKDIKDVYKGKGVRLDVYVDDEESTVYNLEMQTDNRGNLEHRIRFYQSKIDTNLLKEGVDYKKLNKCYIIFICCFDYFRLGRYKYTFENICAEDTELKLNDGAYKIFLNTKGSIGDVSNNLKDFLKYIENSTDEFAKKSESRLVKKINDNINEIKKSQIMGVSYMFEEIHRSEVYNDGKEEGIEIGKEEGIEIGIDQMIISMIKFGFESILINSVTHVPIERIEKLREAYV